MKSVKREAVNSENGTEKQNDERAECFIRSLNSPLHASRFTLYGFPHLFSFRPASLTAISTASRMLDASAVPLPAMSNAVP